MVESRELRVGEYLNIRKVRGILRLFQLSQGRLGYSGFVDRGCELRGTSGMCSMNRVTRIQ